jgi:hypothetical protein
VATAAEPTAAASSSRMQHVREMRAFNFVGATLARMMIASSIKAIFENS